jgi:hypothetical protein
MSRELRKRPLSARTSSTSASVTSWASSLARLRFVVVSELQVWLEGSASLAPAKQPVAPLLPPKYGRRVASSILRVLGRTFAVIGLVQSRLVGRGPHRKGLVSGALDHDTDAGLLQREGRPPPSALDLESAIARLGAFLTAEQTQ